MGRGVVTVDASNERRRCPTSRNWVACRNCSDRCAFETAINGRRVARSISCALYGQTSSLWRWWIATEPP
jgi:hypothetical protein